MRVISEWIGMNWVGGGRPASFHLVTPLAPTRVRLTDPCLLYSWEGKERR
jgi:hypothetical protein